MSPDDAAPVPAVPEPRTEAERLFRELNDALLSYASARVHSWADAKDVVQENLLDWNTASRTPCIAW